MKIGTITLSNSQENYGQALQCYALVEYLRLLGHEAFLIRAKHLAIDNRSFKEKIISRITLFLNPIKLYRHYLEVREYNRQHRAMNNDVKEHPRYFDDFFKDNIPSTEIWYDDISIFTSTPEADAYICGSDQIWGGDDTYMYLQFAQSGAIKISYAVSFGGYIPSSDVQKKIRGYLSDFKWITLREQSGTDICRGMGFNHAETVPDPTLLLSVDRYRKVYKSTSNAISQPYLLLYLLGNEMPLDVEEIYKFAKKHTLHIIYVSSQGRNDQFEKKYPTIEQWLDLIENADYIITNSYHGTIFSILFHKKFLSIPITGIRARMNTRLEELLSRYNLKERLYSGSLETLFQDVDYTCFENVNQKEKSYISDKFAQILA